MKVKEFFRRFGILELNGKMAIEDDELEILVKDHSAERTGVLADIKSIRINSKNVIVIDIEE